MSSFSRERPISEPLAPFSETYKPSRGIISPCTGCKNNIPVDAGELEGIEYGLGQPCPKRLLYAKKEQYEKSDIGLNWTGPVFDDKLQYMNPVWPALKKHDNAYAYVFVAKYEDNVTNGWNPYFDTERIVCSGPYLIKDGEREWHLKGHLEQRDPVLITNMRYSIEGQEFEGFVEHAQIWQVARGYVREIDHNIVKSMSGAGE